MRADTGISIGPNNAELRAPLMSSGAQSKPRPGLVQRLMEGLDERTSVKLLLRKWGPRAELLVRLMLVSSFLEDSYGTATRFSDHARQVAATGLFGSLFTASEATTILAAVCLFVGLLTQFFGSLCLVLLVRPNHAIRALIVWTVAQPILYDRLSNFTLVAESLSIVGGLLLVRAHLVPGVDAARISARGRALLSAVYVYHAVVFLSSAVTLDETTNLASFLASLSLFVLNVTLLVVLALGSVLVFAGLRSRAVALTLAVVNLVSVCYRHPFFLYYYDSERTMPLLDGLGFNEIEPAALRQLHRYYFFLGVSTSGALLSLAQFGPGETAVQQDETLLPYVNRAQD